MRDITVNGSGDEGNNDFSSSMNSHRTFENVRYIRVRKQRRAEKGFLQIDDKIFQKKLFSSFSGCQ